MEVRCLQTEACGGLLQAGIVKEQETLAVVAALFLSIAANTLTQIPGSVTALGKKSNLPTVYLWASLLYITFLTASIALAVLNILMWNAQEDDDPYGDLVMFLCDRWYVLAQVPVLCVLGLGCLAANLYCVILSLCFADVITESQPLILSGPMFLGFIWLLCMVAVMMLPQQKEQAANEAPQHTPVHTVPEPLPGAVQVPVWELQEQALSAESSTPKKRTKGNGSRGQLARSKVAAVHADGSLPGEADESY